MLIEKVKERCDVMKKQFLIPGIILIVATIVLIILGFYFRSMFYGIMDAPYSVYGKYGTYAKICFIIGIITALLGLTCFAVGIIKHNPYL